MEKDFRALVEAKQGFEMVLGYQDYVDHCIGGKGNKLWYFINSKKKKECWMAEYDGITSKETHIVVRKGTPTVKQLEPGTTLKLVNERAFYYQDEFDPASRTPSMVDLNGYPVKHYSFAFGALAVDISEEYGVTLGFSDIEKEEEGYRVRDLLIGSSVEIPKF